MLTVKIGIEHAKHGVPLYVYCKAKNTVKNEEKHANKPFVYVQGMYTYFWLEIKKSGRAFEVVQLFNTILWLIPR